MHSAVVYGTDASRIATAYRLVTRSAAARTLLLVAPGQPPIQITGWDGEVLCRNAGHDFSHLSSFDAGSFDRVVLHWALGGCGKRYEQRRSVSRQRDLLREALRLLKPGGSIAGCEANLLVRPR